MATASVTNKSVQQLILAWRTQLHPLHYIIMKVVLCVNEKIYGFQVIVDLINFSYESWLLFTIFLMLVKPSTKQSCNLLQYSLYSTDQRKYTKENTINLVIIESYNSTYKTIYNKLIIPSNETNFTRIFFIWYSLLPIALYYI